MVSSAHTRENPINDNTQKKCLHKSAESQTHTTLAFVNAAPLEDELFHQQRAAFLDVPLEVLQSKRQFDLIKLLRKRRNERLAKEAAAKEGEAEEEQLVEPGTMIKVHIQTIKENKNSAVMEPKKKVLKKRRVPRSVVAAATTTTTTTTTNSSSAMKTVQTTRPKNFVFQEDHQTDAHKAILETVVLLPVAKPSAQKMSEATTPLDCVSEADSDLLTSFEDSESDEFFKTIATESTQTGSQQSSSTSSASTDSEDSDDCHTEADEECFYKKFAAGKTRVSVVEKECSIPVRDLVKIVPCEVLGTELFKQVTLAQPLSLSALMKVANEEWKCLADIDCPEARAQYFAEVGK